MALEKHGHQHCPGGPDEIPCLVPAWAWMTGGGADTATGTYTDLVGAGEAYDEGFDNSGGVFTVDLDDTGYIGVKTLGKTIVTAQVEAPGALSAGDVFDVAINRGAAGVFSSFRIGNPTTVDAVTAEDMFTVTYEHVRLSNAFGSPSFRLEVYHDHGSAVTVATWELHVTHFPLSSFGIVYPGS